MYIYIYILHVLRQGQQVSSDRAGNATSPQTGAERLHAAAAAEADVWVSIRRQIPFRNSPQTEPAKLHPHSCAAAGKTDTCVQPQPQRQVLLPREQSAD